MLFRGYVRLPGGKKDWSTWQLESSPTWKLELRTKQLSHMTLRRPSQAQTTRPQVGFSFFLCSEAFHFQRFALFIPLFQLTCWYFAGFGCLSCRPPTWPIPSLQPEHDQPSTLHLVAGCQSATQVCPVEFPFFLLNFPHDLLDMN